MKKDNILFVFSIMIFIFSLFIFVGTCNSLYDLIKITGKSVSTGNINISIEQIVLVNFTIDNVDWGSGVVSENATKAIIDTMGNVINGSWDPVSSGFVIENIGNINLSLNFSSLKNATTFIGGTNSSYQYKISNIDENACVPPSGFDLDNFYEFPSEGVSVNICKYFVPGKNILFDLNLTISYDSNTGNLSDTITLAFQESD
ncbi:MAG: hypothetical protein WC548_03020 [Candidatus Pacearchaeota archaeon]